MLVCICICHGDCLNGEKDLVKLIIVIVGESGIYGHKNSYSLFSGVLTNRSTYGKSENSL